MRRALLATASMATAYWSFAWGTTMTLGRPKRFTLLDPDAMPHAEALLAAASAWIAALCWGMASRKTSRWLATTVVTLSLISQAYRAGSINGWQSPLWNLVIAYIVIIVLVTVSPPQEQIHG
jgi:hypothetical protein